MMKPALVVSLSASGFQALALREKLEQNLKLLKGLKFKAAELHVRDPGAIDLKATVAAMERSGMQCPTIGTGQAFFDEGLSLTSKDKSVRRKARERMKRQLEFAAHFECLITIGLIRGIPKKEDKANALKLLADELDALCEYAPKAGAAGLVLEPLNRYETSIINTIAEAGDLIKKSGAKNLGILADSFHMNIEERDITDSIKKNAALIRHVHLADSNRWAPGQGHFDFDELFAALKSIGYECFVSGEYLPLPDPERSVRLFAQFLKKRRLLF
jgi:5-keto-L-gluconate epimerase